MDAHRPCSECGGIITESARLARRHRRNVIWLAVGLWGTICGVFSGALVWLMMAFNGLLDSWILAIFTVLCMFASIVLVCSMPVCGRWPKSAAIALGMTSLLIGIQPLLYLVVSMLLDVC